MPNLRCEEVAAIRGSTTNDSLRDANVLLSKANDSFMVDVDELSEQVANLTYQKECLTNERDYEKARADDLNGFLTRRIAENALCEADNDVLRRNLKKAKRRIRRLKEEHESDLQVEDVPDYENQKALAEAMF